MALHPKQVKTLEEVGVVGAVVIVVFLLFARPSSSSQKASAPAPAYSEAFLENYAQTQEKLAEAKLGARTQEVGQAFSYATSAQGDSTALSEAQIEGQTSEYLGNLQYKTAVNQDNAAINLANIQSAMEQALGLDQQRTSEYDANQQTQQQQNAESSQSQQSWWSGLFQDLGLAAIFGL